MTPNLPNREMLMKMTVAFDVDGTLIHMAGDLCDTPRYDVVQLFKLLEAFGCEMYIWSGGGIDYATRWRDKLGLKAEVIRKGSMTVDLAIDDLPSDDVDNEKIKQTLGKVLLKV